MRKYTVDLGDDEFITIPENIRYQIVQDHLTKSYHWVIGFGMLIIGFLLGVIACG
jgi:hypothetical protein